MKQPAKDILTIERDPNLVTYRVELNKARVHRADTVVATIDHVDASGPITYELDRVLSVVKKDIDLIVRSLPKDKRKPRFDISVYGIRDFAVKIVNSAKLVEDDNVVLDIIAYLTDKINSTLTDFQDRMKYRISNAANVSINSSLYNYIEREVDLGLESVRTMMKDMFNNYISALDQYKSTRCAAIDHEMELGQDYEVAEILKDGMVERIRIILEEVEPDFLTIMKMVEHSVRHCDVSLRTCNVEGDLGFEITLLNVDQIRDRAIKRCERCDEIAHAIVGAFDTHMFRDTFNLCVGLAVDKAHFVLDEARETED